MFRINLVFIILHSTTVPAFLRGSGFSDSSADWSEMIGFNTAAQPIERYGPTVERKIISCCIFVRISLNFIEKGHEIE